MSIYPKLSDYYSAVKSLDADEPKSWSLRRAMDYMQRPLKYNLRLMGHYTTRVAAVAAWDWTLTGEINDDLKARIIRRIAPAVKVLIENNPRAYLFGSLAYRLDLSNVLESGTVIIPKMLDRRSYAVQNEELHLWNAKGSYQKSTAVVLADQDNILVDNVSWMSPGAVMRGIAAVEILRHDMILENANFLRKLKGILQIINKGGGEDNVNAAKSAAATAIMNNYLITDDLIEFKLNDIAGKGDGAFEKFIDWANKEMAIAMLGQANTSELPDGGGSRAALTVLSKLSQDIFWHDISRVTQIANQLVQKDYELNVSDSGDPAPWKFQITIPDDADIESNASALETLKRANIPVKKDEAYTMLGLTKPDPTDDLL